MNSVKLQNTRLIYRNQSIFNILIMNYQKENLRKHRIYNHVTKNKTPRKKHTQGGKRHVFWKLQTVLKEYERKLKKFTQPENNVKYLESFI